MADCKFEHNLVTARNNPPPWKNAISNFTVFCKVTKSFPFYFHQIFLNPHLCTKEHKSPSSKYILSSSFSSFIPWEKGNKNTHRNLASNLSWDFFFDLCKTPLLIMKMCFQGIYWSLYLQCYIFVLPQRKVRIRCMKLFWCLFLVMDRALVPR